MFPTADLTEFTQRYYDIYSVRLAIGTVAKTAAPMYKYCSRTVGCDWNPLSKSFFLNA